MSETSDRPRIVQRLGGQLHSVRDILDEEGKVIDRLIEPLMVEIGLRDLAQIIIGALVLAIPVALAEEVWTLGKSLAARIVAGIALVSITFTALFV